MTDLDINLPKQPRFDLEVATIQDGRDITRGYLGPLLVPQDRLLNMRGDDLRVYENVLSEPQVQSVLQQRRLAITRCEWRVDPASEARVDKKAADLVKKQLDRVGWDNVTDKMHYGVFYGYAASEVIYERVDGQVGLGAIKVRNRRRFRFDKDAKLRLLTYQNMMPGELCDSPYFWHYATGADNDDEPYGLGLAHWLYWPTLFKRNGLKFWLTFLEKYGMPTAMGTYPANATAQEKANLLAATQAIRIDSGFIVPQGMAMELLKADRSGTADYKALQDNMDEAMAKVVLGQSMTSESRGGQYKSEVQHDVRQDLVKADADLICESFNLTVGRWLTAWNFSAAQPPKVYRVVEEPEDLNQMATRDKSIYSMGFKPSQKYIQDTYGGDWTPTDTQPELQATPAGAALVEGLPVPAPPVPSPANPAAAFAEGVSGQGDVAVRMTPQADKQMQPVMTRWIGQLRDLVDKAKSLEELRDAVLKLQPDMPLDDYATIFAQALAAAHLAGRQDITDQAGAP